MKKTLFSILILVICLCSQKVSAQSTTTAANGTETNSYLPIYGYYADAYQRSQTIYPSPMLSSMVNNTITSMTFYLSQVPEQDWGGSFVFQLGTTTNTNFSTSAEFITPSNLTQVYSGSVTIANNEMTIHFSNPFIYTGGNLLLDVQLTAPGNYSNATFIGLNTAAYFSTRGYNFNDISSINPSGQMFIPKITFTHSTDAACFPPNYPVITNIGTNSATLSWTPQEGQNSWQVYCDTGLVDFNQIPWINVTDTFYTFTGLTPNTEYNTYLRTNCGESQSFRIIRTFWTTLIAMDMPFFCDFEDENFNSTFMIRNNNETNRWNIGTAVNNTPNGAKSLYISNNNGQDNTYANESTSAVWAFFDVNFPNASEFLLSFDWKAYGEGNDYFNYDYLGVYIGQPANVDAGSAIIPDGATEIGQYNLQSEWQTVNELLPSSYANTLQRIYFLWRNDHSMGTNPPASIDNISLTTINCRRPDSLIIRDITTNSVTIDITPAQNSQWEILCTNNTNTPIVISTDSPNNIHIGNLNPSDYYTICARTICDDGDTSIWSPAQSFHTECGSTLNVPQTWGFEEDWEPVNFFEQENMSPLCWHVYNGGATSTNYNWTWNHIRSSAFAHSGDGSAFCYTDYASEAHNDWLITPQIALTGTQMLSFYAQRFNTTTNEPEEISIWISNEDISLTAPDSTTEALPGFTQLYQTAIPQGAYQLYEVPLEGYNGNRHIAFVRRNTPHDGYYLRLDDVTIDELPTCLRPNHLHVTSISENDANIAWTPTGSPVNIYYRSTNTPNFILINSSPIYDSTFTLINLTPATPYEVYVASVCNDETEQATQPVSFTTDCQTVLVTENSPFTENFNSLTNGIPNCWDNSEGTTTENSNKWNYNENGENGSACVRFNSFINYSGNTNMLKTPVLNLSTLTHPTVSFSYRNPSGGDFSVLLSTDGGHTYPTVIASNLTNVTEWTNVDYVLYNLTNTENVVIVFQGTSNYGNGDAYIYLDNVIISEGAQCARPTNFNVFNITNNTISLSWQETGTATNWNIAYGPTGFTFTDSTITETTTDTSITIMELTTGQMYDFYVQADCGDFTSDWRGPVSATPGSFIFGTNGSQSITSCGILLYDNGGPNGDYSNECNYSLTVYPSEPNEIVTISGTFQGESNYDYLSIYNGTTMEEDELLLKVYSSMNGSDDNGLVSFGPITSEIGPLTIHFFSDAIIQNTGFEATVSCVAAPTCYRPYRLSVDNLSTDKATVSWIDLSENATLELYYKAHDDTVYTTVPSSAFTGENSFQMTNLTPATSYDVYVTAFCDNDTLSSNILNFKTLCTSFDTYPFVETFEETSPTIDCWSIIDANNDQSTYTLSNGNVYYQWHGTNPADDWLISPTFILDGEQVVDFDYWSSNIYAEKFQVFAIDTDGNQIALSQVITVQTEVTQNMLLDLSALTGPYRIGIHCVSDADMFKFYLSNFRIKTTTTAALVVEPTSLSFNTITNIASSAKTITISGIALSDNISLTTAAPFELSTDGVTFSTSGFITVNNMHTFDTIIYVRYNPSIAGTHNGSVTLSSDTTSATITLTGTSIDCAARTLPYSEDFDSYTEGIASGVNNPDNYPEGDMPQCWLFPNRSEFANVYPIVFLSSSSEYAVSGNCLFFKSSRNTPAYAVLPEFSSEIQNTKMYFTYRNGGTSNFNGTLSVGYMTDITDVTTYTEISTFARTTILSEELILFNTVPSSVINAHIAFKYTGGTSDNYYLSIDNIQVEEINITPDSIPPTVVTNDATNITQNEATLNATITNPDNVTITAKGFVWEANVGGTPTYIAGTGTGNDFSASLTGLIANTDYSYKAYISFNSDTVYGNEISFTTLEVGIDNITLANSISLIPNPADNYIEVTVNSTVSVKEAMVYNAFGQMIQTIELTNNHARIDLSGMASGMYFVRMNDANGNIATKKFIRK